MMPLFVPGREGDRYAFPASCPQRSAHSNNGKRLFRGCHTTYKRCLWKFCLSLFGGAQRNHSTTALSSHSIRFFSFARGLMKFVAKSLTQKGLFTTLLYRLQAEDGVLAAASVPAPDYMVDRTEFRRVAGIASGQNPGRATRSEVTQCSCQRIVRAQQSSLAQFYEVSRCNGDVIYSPRTLATQRSFDFDLSTLLNNSKCVITFVECMIIVRRTVFSCVSQIHISL